jgi:hypothetical protein
MIAGVQLSRGGSSEQPAFDHDPADHARTARSSGTLSRLLRSGRFKPMVALTAPWIRSAGAVCSRIQPEKPRAAVITCVIRLCERRATTVPVGRLLVGLGDP